MMTSIASHACHCPRCCLDAAEHDVAHWTALVGGYGLDDAALLTAARALQAAVRERTRCQAEVERAELYEAQYHTNEGCGR